MSTQITSNQISYTSYYATLSVTAEAARAGTDAVTITAQWEIYTAGSSLTSATRYLVLYVGSASGSKYYSAAIRSGSWSKETTYTGTATFTVPLAADATEITIGFGVSDTNTAPGVNTTLIWNGNSQYDSTRSAIQFATITGIPVGYVPPYVYIRRGGTWRKYVLHICTGGTWRKHRPRIRNGTAWKKYGGA